MNRRTAARVGALILLLMTVGEAARAQAAPNPATEPPPESSSAVAAANLRAGIAVPRPGDGIRLDTAAAGTATHRRAHAARGAAIGAVAGAGAGIVAAALIVAEDRRHPERHGGQVDKRTSAAAFFMGALGIVGAGAGALVGATLGALIP